MSSESGGAPPRRQMTPEVVAGIQQLGVDPNDERLMKLVDDLLRPESLPKGWAAAFDAATGAWRYTHSPSGQVSGRHPCYGYYQGAIFLDKGGYAALKANRAAYPPREEEVSSMGAYFGIKEEEEDYVWEVAEMALAAPLPPGWDEVPLPAGAGGEPPGIGYKHASTGELLEEHPLDSYFRELLRRRRRELMRRKKAALKAVNAIAAFGWRRSSAAVGGQPQQPPPPPPSHPPELSPDKLDALKAEWASVLTTAQQLVNGLTALPLTQHARAMAAVGGGAATAGGPGGAEAAAAAAVTGAAAGGGHAGVRSPAEVPGDDAADGGMDPEYATHVNSSSAAAAGAVSHPTAFGPAAAATWCHAASCSSSSSGCCCSCHADPAGDVTRWLSQLAVTPAALLASAAAATDATGSLAVAGPLIAAGGAATTAAAATSGRGATPSAAGDAAVAGAGSMRAANSSLGQDSSSSNSSTPGFQEGAADLGGVAGAAAGNSAQGPGPWQLRRNSSIKRKLMQLQSVLSTATDKPDGSHLLSQQQPGAPAAGSTAVDAGQRQAAAQVNRPSRLSASTSNTQLWAAAAAGAGGAAGAATTAGGAAATSFSGFMSSGGALEDDSGETAAMAHLGAIKATMQEALGFLGSWRQQQLVLGALQLQLQQAYSRLADRNSRLKQLEAAQSELSALRAAQEKQAKEEGDLAAILQQQLQQSQHRCSTLDQTVLQLQQQLEAEQALVKQQAEEAASLTKELTTTREQLEEEQQLRSKEGGESAEKLTALTADLEAAQQQLAAALDQVAALQQLTSRLNSDSESAATALTSQLQQLQAELTMVKAERDAALLELEGLKAAAAEAAGRKAALEEELSAAQQQAAGLQQEVAALTASLKKAQASAARPPAANRWTQTEPPPPRPHWRSAPGGYASSSGGGGGAGWPNVSPQRGLHSLSPNRPVMVPVRRDSGGWDSSPIPAEVRTRVDRAKDRQLKLKVEDPLPFLLPGTSSSGALPGLVLPGGGGSQSGGLGLASLAGGVSGSFGGLSRAASMVGGGLLKGRWEYAIDERDAEICSLKQRLVEVERRSREAASRAEADVKRLAAELQSAYKCLGTVAVSQSGGLDLQQAAANLRATLSNYGGGGGGVAGFNSRASALQWGRVSTASPGDPSGSRGSLSCPGGMAPLSSSSGGMKVNSISTCGGTLGCGSNTRAGVRSSADRGSMVAGGGEGKGVRFSSLFQERAPAASTAVVWPSLMSRRWSAAPAAAGVGDGGEGEGGNKQEGGTAGGSNQQQQQQQQGQAQGAAAQQDAGAAAPGWGQASMARPVRMSMSANAALSSRSRGSEEAEQ